MSAEARGNAAAVVGRARASGSSSRSSSERSSLPRERARPILTDTRASGSARTTAEAPRGPRARCRPAANPTADRLAGDGALARAANGKPRRRDDTYVRYMATWHRGKRSGPRQKEEVREIPPTKARELVYQSQGARTIYLLLFKLAGSLLDAPELCCVLA